MSYFYGYQEPDKPVRRLYSYDAFQEMCAALNVERESYVLSAVLRYSRFTKDCNNEESVEVSLFARSMLVAEEAWHRAFYDDDFYVQVKADTRDYVSELRVSIAAYEEKKARHRESIETGILDYVAAHQGEKIVKKRVAELIPGAKYDEVLTIWRELEHAGKL